MSDPNDIATKIVETVSVELAMLALIESICKAAIKEGYSTEQVTGAIDRSFPGGVESVRLYGLISSEIKTHLAAAIGSKPFSG